MQRLLLGLIALVMLAGGLALQLSRWSEFWSESLAFMAMRVGILLGVLWLAWPQVCQLLQRVSPTTLVCALIGGLVLLVSPRQLLRVGPILAAVVALQFVVNLFRDPSAARRKRPR